MKKLLVAVALLLGGSTSVKAGSTEDMWVRQLGAIGMAQRVFGSSSTSMNVTYVGTSTEAYLTITGITVTGYAPYNVKDANFGLSSSSYQINTAAYDTFGELCDAIDNLADYKCTLLGAKRNDDSALLRDATQTQGTADLKAAGGFDILFDTGSLVSAQTDVYALRVGINPQAGRSVRLKSCVTNVNVIDSLRVHGKLKKFEGASDGVTRDDTTLVWQQATADDTDLTETWAVSEAGGLDFAKDAHVVIGGGFGTGIQASANMLECRWEER